MDTSTLLQDLNRRYATKKFDSTKKLDKSQVEALLESARLAPSSYGLQPRKFIVVENQSLKEQLLVQSYQQSQVVDASHLIVMCIKKDFSVADVDAYVQDMVTTRQVKKDDLAGYRDMMVQTVQSMDQQALDAWMRCQVYIALGFILAQAAHMHIDTCPMEGIIAEKYDEVLGLGDSYHTVVACPVGIRSNDDDYADAAKVRFEGARIVERRA